MPKVWVDAGPVSHFPPQTMTEVQLHGRSVGIIHSPSGLHAIRNECPHQGAPMCRGVLTGTMVPSAPGEVAYGFKDEIVRCPWHGWEFFVTSGEAAFGISSRRLVTYDVDIRNDHVFVLIYIPAGGATRPPVK